MRPRRPTLDAVLAYRNPDVVDKFCSTWDVPRADARPLFSDTLRYLWLMSRVDFEIVPVSIVDEMWHTFLLFTKPYLEWSERTFGYVMHHNPVTKTEKRAAARTTKAMLLEGIERDVTAVYDHLGKAVALRWYVAYADKYPQSFFDTARLPIERPHVRYPMAVQGTNRAAHG